MKKLALLLVLSLAAHADPGQRLIVAVSPDLPPALRPEIATRVAKLLYEGSIGTEVTVFNAGTMRDIARVTLEGNSIPLRQQRHQDAIIAAFQNIKTNAGSGFNVPVVLDEISRQLRPTNAVVLLIGPALYYNSKEPSHDMRKGWPSDGHLSAGRERSVFSTVERAHFLNGLAVNWLVTDVDAVMNESHRDGIARFWSLFIATQGGTLAAFTPNPGTAFASAISGRATPCIPAEFNPRDKEVVFHTRDIDMPRRVVTVTNTVLATNIVFITNVVAQPPSTILPRVAAGNTRIGIVWCSTPGRTVNVDLDLYVVVPRDREELSFRHATTAHGRYYRDVRQSIPSPSGDWKTAWEFVELQGDQLPHELWVNLFEGQGPISGEAHIEFKGVDHIVAFTLPAVTGRHGIDADRRDSCAEWLRIDLGFLKENR